MRVLRVIAVVLVLLFVAAQLAGGPSHATTGRPQSAGAPAKSHLDEARGHLDAVLNLFR